MAREYGIAVGKKIKVFGFKSGVGANGRYQLFNWVEKVKNQNGEYVPTQKYTFFIENEEQLNLPNGTDIKIESISKIIPTWNSYKAKDGKQINERVIQVFCRIETSDNTGGVYNSNDNGVDNDMQEIDNDPFGSIADDAFDINFD